MKDELTIRDFYNFIREHIKTIISIIIFALILTITFVVYSHINYDENTSEATSPVELPTSTLSDERYEEVSEWPLELYSDSQIKQMQAYLLPRAYRITIYAEHENHEPVANTTFMREVFRNKAVLEYVESKLGEKLTPAIEFAIHIENLSNSGVYEIHLQRGTQEESLELAYIVTEAINEGVIPVLSDKTVQFITEEPEVIIGDYSEYSETMNQPLGFSVKVLVRDIIIYSVIAIILAIILGIIISLIMSFLSPKISSLFDYAREESDRILRLNHLRNIDRRDKLDKALTNINLPVNQNKIILYDENTKNEFEELFMELNSNITFYTDFATIDKDVDNIDEVILLSLVNKTSKNWYNNQRLQLKGYNIPIKIIQF